MKIDFDGVNTSSRSGPNTFAFCLAHALSDLGHDIVETGMRADVSLVFIEPSGKTLANKIVQRLDGVWSKPKEFSWRNEAIKKLYQQANAVVFQSEFDKDFVLSHWQAPKSHSVIHNGTQLKQVKNFSSPTLEAMRQRYEKVFVCSANWHRQKRLKENIDLYNHLRESLKLDSCLIVMGDHPDYRYAASHVYYAGSVPRDVYMQIYSMADWMIHLSWCDHCPNVVVECLSQETPVICSSDGGTKELVKDFGVVLNESVTFSNTLFDYDNPPELDVTQIKTLPTKTQLGVHADVDIVTSAKAYEQLLLKVILQ